MDHETLASLLSVNYLIAGTPVGLALMGWEIWTLRKRGESLRLNNSISSINCGMFSNLINVFVLPGLAAFLVWLGPKYGYFDMTQLSVPQSLLAFLALFVAADFMFYWAHRFTHECNVGWAAHSVHHQSEDMNFTVASRNSAFQPFVIFSFIAPLVLIGFPPMWVFSMFTFVLAYQFWVHTEIIGRLPEWMEYFLNTPSSHRVHHGTNHQYLDKNYGAVLVIWDRLFGTFETENEKVRYGVIEPYRSWDGVAANFNVFVSLYHQARKLPRWSDRIRIWFKAPGWDPAGPKPIPSTEGRPIYDAPIPSSQRKSVITLFILGLLLGTVVVSVPPDKQLWPITLGLAFMELCLLIILGRKIDAVEIKPVAAADEENKSHREVG